MADIRALSGPDLRFDGTRALLLDVGAPLPCSALHALIRTALTYHLGKRAES